MLAGAEVVGFKIKTGAKVHPRFTVPDRHLVGILCFGVVHRIVAKYRVTIQLFNGKILAGYKLFSERDLPGFQRQVGWFAMIWDGFGIFFGLLFNSNWFCFPGSWFHSPFCWFRVHWLGFVPGFRLLNGLVPAMA